MLSLNVLVLRCGNLVVEEELSHPTIWLVYIFPIIIVVVARSNLWSWLFAVIISRWNDRELLQLGLIVSEWENVTPWQWNSTEDKPLASIRPRAPVGKAHHTGNLPRRDSVRIPPSISLRKINQYGNPILLHHTIYNLKELNSLCH